jgi:hypothetical protein
MNRAKRPTVAVSTFRTYATTNPNPPLGEKNISNTNRSTASAEALANVGGSLSSAVKARLKVNVTEHLATVRVVPSVPPLP